MRVTVHFAGMLRITLGEETVQIDLEAPATFGGLLKDLGRRFGKRFPPAIWDADAGCFTGPVLVVGDGRDLTGPETILKENEIIRIVSLAAGG